MPYTIRFFFSFIFLCGIFSTSRASTSKGDSLYASGKYFEASIEYERQIFKETDRTGLNYLKYRKALCYKKMKDFDRALGELLPVYFPDSGDSLYRLVCYEQSLCFYLNGEPAKALWKIDEFFHRSDDIVSFRYFMPLKILCLNETFQWDEAEKCFQEFLNMQHFSPEKKAEMRQLITNLYGKGNRPQLKLVKKAENLSRFIPGSGQVYAGKSGEGIVNFLMNASVLTFAGYQAYHGFYITGYLAGLGFFNKTYHGGIKRAGILASQRNKTLVLNFNREIHAIMLSSFDLN